MGTLDLKKWLLGSTLLIGASAVAFAPAAYAQDDADGVAVIEEDDEDTAEDDGDTVIVTGSRIRRNEFTSASPLKVIDIEEVTATGAIDTASIVQRTSVAGGTQFDNTFTGQVTDSGPGSATVSLRGLDAERTLVLSNGRRLAPAGVRGAPTRPDLNLIPLANIDRIDILTDGASAIFGADAVAGVINVITRRDFEGVEFDFFASEPEAGAGEERRISLATGLSSDRGHFSFGAEYFDREVVKRGDRSFTPCERDVEINPETGERREICAQFAFGNQFLDATNLFFGGGVTNDGLGADFNIFLFDFDNGSGFVQSPSNNQPGGPGTQLGNLFPYDTRYNFNRGNDQFDLVQGLERASFFTDGEYQTDQMGNATFYFEGLYGQRTQEIFAGPSQIFPSVPCSNPFIQADPVLSQTPACTFAPAAQFGLDQLIYLPFINDQSGAINVDVQTARGVFGVKGDLESFIPTGKYKAGGDNFGFNLGNWNYDMWASFDHNVGVDRQRTLNEERLFASLVTATTAADGSVVCGIDGIDGDLFGFIAPETCVPLDVTDPNVFINGELPADVLEYVSGLNQTTTTIDQAMFQASIAGDLAYTPAGTIPFVLGIELREDSLETLNSFQITAGAGTDGRSEGNTVGSTSLVEVFMETEIPLLKGKKLAEELTVNLAGRWTEEENFGALWTYRVQGIYRPNDWLTGRASFGTTFRAPNLREQFLANQIAFISAFADPCIVSNFNNIIDAEDAARVRNNCALQGADVDTLGAGGAVTPTVSSGGNQRLEAETSEALTAGFVIEQPWFDAFDLNLAVTYFKFEIENSIEEPNAGFILNECIFESTNLDSSFCDLITRVGNPDQSRNFIDNISANFFNVGLIETDGVDVDMGYRQSWPVNGNELTLSSNLSASYVASSRRDLFDEVESFDGRPNLPHWRGDMQTRAEYRDWAFNHNVRYIGETRDDDIDAIRQNDIIDEATGTVFFAAGFRDVEETEEQFIHDFSVQYYADTWSATFGVENAFDKEPPIVDAGEGYLETNGAVIGGGYDVFGRTYFARLRKYF